MGAGLSLATGTVFAADFRIERPLAQGGMGMVYVAHQSSTGRRRALKLMNPDVVHDDDARRRFVLEAKVGAQIPSEHVVAVQTAGVDAATGIPYLVMELLEGEDLAERLRRAGPLSLDETRDLFRQVCHALGAAHALGIVHRDIKPSNVFLAEESRVGAGDFVVKVLDFGLAKLTTESTTLTHAKTAHGSMLGTPLWMAPEQADTAATVSPSTDVWALGLLLYTTLTGRSFWRAGAGSAPVMEILREVLLDPLPSATARARQHGVGDRIPEALEDVFLASIVRAQASRFPDATSFWLALDAALKGAPLPVRPKAPLAAPLEERPTSIAPTLGAVAPSGGAVTIAEAPSNDMFARPKPTPPPARAPWRWALVGVIALPLVYGGVKLLTPSLALSNASFSSTCRLCTVDEGNTTFANGPLELQQIRHDIEARFPELDARCIEYAREAGRATIQLRVEDQKVRKSVAAPPASDTARCLQDALDGMVFGPERPRVMAIGAAVPSELGTTKVTYTFEFDPRRSPLR